MIVKNWIAGMVAVGLTISSSPIWAAEEEKVAVNGSMAVLNRYVFRGYQIGKNSIVFQPSLGAAYKGFSANFWGNIDSDEHATQSFVPDSPGQKSFNETDLTLSYTHPLGNLELSGGYIYYGTRYAPETEEFYLSASYNTWARPTLTLYQDFSSYPGTYLNLSFSQSWKVYKGITLDLGASAAYFWGWSNYWNTFDSSTGAYTGDKYRAFQDGMVKAGVTVPLAQHLTLQPMVQYYFPLSDKAKRMVEGNPYNPNGTVNGTFVYGVNLAFGF
jgi:hypothetical protein